MRRKAKPRSRPAPPRVVTAEQQDQLLAKVREGVDPGAMIAALGLDAAAVWADAALAERIEAYYSIHTEGVRKQAIAQAAQGGHVHILERELDRREERAAELRRQAANSTGHAGSEWIALFDQLDDDEHFLAHSLLSGDISQFRASLRCMVVKRAVELTRDPDWLASINTRWAEAIRATMQPKPEPRRVDEIEVLDADEVIPPDKSIVPFRSPLAGSAPYNPPRTTLNHPMARR